MATAQQTAAQLKRLFSFMPGIFAGKKNFSTMLGAIAQSDADLNNLFLEVKKQLFVDTASGEYLDMLGSNVGVTRPPLIGMVDADFRSFIKLQTYFPKQIRQLLFRLMELFYGTDTIKANVRSGAFGPFQVFDGATLEVTADGLFPFVIVFHAADFNNPNSVTADELAADINSQIQQHLFASTYTNAIDKQEFLTLFTDTYGPVGSIQVTGGSANRFLKFPNTFHDGATISSQYRIQVQSTTARLYWAGGDNPLFSQLLIGDKVILTGPPFAAANVGSFSIVTVHDTGIPAAILSATSATFQSANVVRYAMPSTSNISDGNMVTINGFAHADNNGTFTVLNVSSTYIDVVSTRTTNADDESAAGHVDLLPSASYIEYANQVAVNASTFGVSSTDDVLFFRSSKVKLESALRPATVWEVNANEIIVTLPATPIVIRRSLAGSSHVQGTSAVVNRAFTSTLTLASDDFFPPANGRFYLQYPDGFVDTSVVYTYGALDPNTLSLLAVSPIINPVGDRLQLGVGPLSATMSSPIVQVTTTAPHNLQSGELVRLNDFTGFAGIPTAALNGVVAVTNVIDQLNFTVTVGASATSTTTNAPSVDKGKVFTTHNSKVLITNVQQNTGYVGAYVYDPKNAPYTISGTQTTLQQGLLLGDFGGSIQVANSGVFPSDTGQVVIGYGRADQEGPIKYIAKPSTGTIFLDPSYRYLKSHSSGAAINLLSSPFGTTPSPTGAQFPVYVVDTVGPRDTLEQLLLDAKAAGVSMKFIVILPNNVYNAFSLYG